MVVALYNSKNDIVDDPPALWANVIDCFRMIQIVKLSEVLTAGSEVCSDDSRISWQIVERARSIIIYSLPDLMICKVTAWQLLMIDIQTMTDALFIYLTLR